MTNERKKPTPRPTRARVRMYQVGFGDCFMLSFEYRNALDDGRKERHILVDFGSTYMAKGVRVVDIAQAIEKDCNGKLDVIVASHRHKDHIGGFGVAGSSEIFSRLEPKLIVRPWTENPEARSSARGHPKERSNRLIESIGQAEAYAATLHEAAGDGARGLRGDLRRMAAAQLPNHEAIQFLNAWALKGDGAYPAFGDPTKIEKYVPGVDVTVLGPPTVEVWPTLTGDRENDPEYWIGRRDALSRALAATEMGTALPEAVAALGENDMSGPVRWLVERMRDQAINSMMRIVRTLDDTLNNTSLILLFSVRDQKFLFSGDAQIENWSYALKHPENVKTTKKLLEDVTLYKIGHHGSRNATPRASLFGLWEKQPRRPKRITSLLSTLSGVHGKSEATQVPRLTLVEALRQRTRLYSTEDLARDKLRLELEADLKAGTPFERVD